MEPPEKSLYWWVHIALPREYVLDTLLSIFTIPLSMPFFLYPQTINWYILSHMLALHETRAQD